MTVKKHDLVAEIRFLTPEEGGRNGPVRTGYRPDHDFGLEDQLNCASHEYVGQEWVQLGETVTVRMTLLVPEAQLNRLYVGFEFTVQEGRRKVGDGKILDVVNEDLRRI